MQKELGNDVVSSQDSELDEIKHGRIANMRESVLSDVNSQAGAFPEQQEKTSWNDSVEQPRDFDEEGSEVHLV